MKPKTFLKMAAVLVLSIAMTMGFGMNADFSGIVSASMAAAETTSSSPDAASAPSDETTQPPDIQWFKDQMKISDKYVEHRQGILGMSWAHFLTMIFLVVFAAGALIAFIQRQKRTKKILEMIRKETSHGNSG